MEAGYALAIVLNVALKMWIIVEAGRQLAEDKRSGAFELLLTTPLTMREIVRGQLRALRRQFLAPLIVAVIFEFTLMILVPYTRTELVPGRLFWVALIVILAADVITLKQMGRDVRRAVLKRAIGPSQLSKRPSSFRFLPTLLFRRHAYCRESLEPLHERLLR